MFISRNNLKPYIHESKEGKLKVFEYGGIDLNMDIAVSIMNCDYPGEGKFAVNTEVETMTYYIIAGKCTFYFEDDKSSFLKKGDCVFIKKNQGYRVEITSNEKVEVLMASNPKWTPQQQIIR